MPENLTPPHAPLIESASGAAPAPLPSAPPAVGEPEPGIASAPVLASPSAPSAALPPEAYAMMELVGRGLAPEADESARSTARDLWARFAQLMGAPAPVMPAAPGMPPAPGMPSAPGMPAAPMMQPTPVMPGAPVMPAAPIPPIAMAVRALRQTPPDQLLDLLLQRVRAALPPGATVPAPRGIQFQLIPVTPPSGSR